MKAIPKARKVGASVAETCDCFDLKRDAFYKYQTRTVKRQLAESKVVELVMVERRD